MHDSEPLPPVFARAEKALPSGLAGVWTTALATLAELEKPG